MKWPHRIKSGILYPLQHIFIKELYAIKAKSCQISVQHNSFNNIKIFNLGLYHKHPVSPHYKPHISTGLIISSHIWKLIIIAIGLMNKLLFKKVSIR